MKKNFKADEKSVRICGRSFVENDITYFGYTNSFIEFEFIGKSASVEIISDISWPEEIYRAWFVVFINDSEVPSQRVKVEEKTGVYELYSSDTQGKVKIRLMKISEEAFSKIGIVNITIDGELLPPPKPQYERRIEFVGDSITCGYGIEGVWNKDTFSTETENPIKGFAYKTAKACKAEFQYVSWSGMGVISNYVDENAEKPRDEWLINDIYIYTNSDLEKMLGRQSHDEHQKWDFSKYVPQVIVFNMGTNDQSWTKDIPQRRQYFMDMYFDFLKTLRRCNPNAYIICTYGVMGQNILEEEISQVERFKKEVDDKICFVTLPVQDEADGIGADWHPSEITHDKVAKLLSEKVNEIFVSMGL